jgi:plasmid stabilization system protein ParE
MGLTVYWTQFAEEKLKDIFEYYKQKAGVKISQKLVNSIIEESLKLESNPFIGQKETLLIDRVQEFRYFVCKNYKIIYWVDLSNNFVFISHVFHTSQNPIKIKNI